MMKKNKLYTVNKWNREAIGDAVEKAVPYPTENLFYVGGDVSKNVLAADSLASQLYGANYGEKGNTLNDYMNSTNAFGLSKANNPFSKMNIQGGIGAVASTGIGRGILSAAGSFGNQLALKGISGGLSSNVGNGIANFGNVAGGVVGQFNPVAGAIIQAGTGAIGGGVNALWGMKTDKEALERANSSISALNNYSSNAESFDDIRGPQAVASIGDVYKGGVFRKGDARKKNEELRKNLADAMAFADRSVNNNIYNISQNQLNDALANYSAFGGPIEQIYNDDMGAINYDFMDRYLTAKEAQNKQKNQMTNLFTSAPSTMFDLGGVLQNHGADWSTGLTHVNAGGTHEESPYDGVQMGVDPQGIPNLVEENETVYNDYVFSNRIMADDATKQLFHLPKKKDITYADISKKLEKEITERPNDPISKAGFNAQMQKLQEQQERQKAEMEAERAREAFEALSPEEKVAVMQQAQQQEQAAQEATMQEQANMPVTQPEQAEMPVQGSPEEMAMQEQMTQQEAPVMAEGGNLYVKGGPKKNVGTWKNDKENHWDVFTKPGLRKYLDNLRTRLEAAPDDATKDAIRREAMNELNGLQQSYFSHVLPTVGSSRYSYSDDILNHQKMFDRLYGNTGFYSTDDNGNVRNLIADAINLPAGAATEDKPDNWFDGYSGPRTSIRNFGSTQYGDDAYYKDLVDDFAKLGLTYAPNAAWKYGDNMLYGLSIPGEGVAPTVGELQEVNPDIPTPKGRFTPTVEDINKAHAAVLNNATSMGVPTKATPTVTAGAATGNEEEFEVEPNYRAEWPRYAGLFSPAVGLGLMAAGVGRPDTSGIEAAANSVGNAYLADYKPIGNYLTYRPMDIWFEQNRMDANARATDRNILNTSGGNRGTAVAGMLANGYNNQIADGELYRKALEYNDALRERTETFNRGTNQFNADAYNRLSQFNADALNRNKQYSAQLAMQAAREKMDADAGWYNSLYGNIGGLFKGLGDLGRENAQHNMIAEMAANGIFGTMSPKTHVGRKGKYLTWKKK